MTTKGRSAAPRQVLSEKGNVRLGMMGLMMLMVVGMAMAQTCTKNLDCGRNTCIAGSCAVKSTPGGPCDTDDKADCSNTGSVCSASNTCQSPVGGQCLANNQCASPGVCVAKRCKASLSAPGGACDDAGDCATFGSTCTGSVCVNPTNPTCATNADCTSPDVCVGHQCSSQSAPEGPCDEAADCAEASSTCGNGKCLSPSGGVCATNGGCGSGQVCIGGQCSNKSPAGGPCDSNSPGDCVVAGSTCTNNVCYSPVGTACSANSECASPNTCLSGSCKAKSAATGFCEEAADCAVIGSSCTSAKCVSPSGGACSSNAGCQSTQVCVSQKCVNKASPGGSCDDASDCSVGGSTCSAGACTSPSGSFCTANRHCTLSSDVCVGQTCVAKRNPGESCDETADCTGTSATCVKAVCRLPNGASCGTNNDACTPPATCLGGTCKAKSSVLGVCDANDGADCVISGSSCESTVCKSPLNAPCNSNSFCATPNTCFRNLCKAKSAPSGPCDSGDAADCSEPSTCSNGICRSNTNSMCLVNSDCALSTDSCIGGVCTPKALPGGTCDTNDDADCKTRNSICSSNTCLSPYQGPCSGDPDCAAGTCSGGFCTITPPTLTWDGHNALPIALEEFSAVAVGTSIWVMGGFNVVTGVASKRVFEYDTDANTWEERTPLPTISYSHSAIFVASQNAIYLIGGRTSQSALHNRVLKYDPFGNGGMGSVVQLVERLPDGYGLISFSTAVMQSTANGNDIIFTFGGLSLGRTNSIFYFDTSNDANPWLVAYADSADPFDNNVLPEPLTYTTATNLGDGYVYIMGGNVDGLVTDYNLLFDPQVSAFNGYGLGFGDPAVEPLSPIPTPRYLHSSFGYNDYVYLLGGASSSDLASYLLTIEEYDPQADEWITYSNPLEILPSERIFAQAVLVGDYVYVIGGRGTSTVAYVEVFDMINFEWITNKAVPSPSQGAAVAAIGSNIVVAGGTNRLGVREDDTQIYDTVNNEWTSTNPIPLPVVNAVGVTDGSVLFVIGGSILLPPTPSSGSTVAVTNKVQVYDPDAYGWIPNPSLPDTMPFARRQACGAYDPTSNNIFVFGGTDISGRASNMTQVFSTIDGTWSVMPFPIPSAIKMCSALTFGDKIFLFGGRDEANALRTQILSFDLATGTWDKPVYPDVIVYENPLVSFLNDFIIIVGGGISTNPAVPTLRTTYAFDPVSRAVFRIDDAPTARYNGGAASIDGVLYVVGGRSTNNIISSVEKLA